MTKIIRIDDLKPTQMTLGMHFVSLNRSEFGDFSNKKLQKLIDRKTVPAVRGPGNRFWIVDRHHFCRSLQEIGVTKVKVEKILDCSHLDDDEFARVMEKSGLIHPYDDTGARLGFADLPPGIGDLVDDPFRTLAGLVREHGGFKKEKRPYAEFLWADFFRRRISRDSLTGDFGSAVKTAVKLAGKRDASHLPGWQ